MRSLIRMEARQQLLWLLVALTLATLGWFGMGEVWQQLVLPPDGRYLAFQSWPIVYACALAQLQFGRDGDERRFGQLVHRAQGARGYFASKVIVGCAALACVIVLPVTIFALVQSASDPDASLIRWVRLPQTWMISVPAYSTYAIGVLSTQLRRGSVARWALALCGLFGAFVLYVPLASLFAAPDRTVALRWAAASSILSAWLVLWLARSLLLAGRDRDLGLRERHLVGLALLLLVVALPFTRFLVGTGGALALSNLQESRLTVLRDPRTGEFLVAGFVGRQWRELEVRDGRIVGTKDATFRVSGGYDADFTYSSTSEPLDFVWSAARSDPDWVRGYRDRWQPARWRRSADSSGAHYPGEAGPTRVWKQCIEVDEASGRVELFATPIPDRRVADASPIRVQLSRPDRPFSPETGVRMFDGVPLLFDRSDASLWSVLIEAGGAHIARVDVPGGDKIVGLDVLVDSSQLEFGSFGGVQGPVFRGEHGVYEWKAGQLGVYVERQRLLPYTDASRIPSTYAVESERVDAFTSETRIERVADHQTVFVLSCEPITSPERTAAAIYSGLDFLRGPESVVRERLLASGYQPLLFVLVMLLGIAQLFIGWRWMVRGGVGVGARIVYLLLIAMGGVVALLFTRLLLPRSLPARRAQGLPIASRLMVSQG